MIRSIAHNPPRLRVLHVLHSLDCAGTERLACDLMLALGEQVESAAVCLDRQGPLAARLREAGLEVRCTQRRPGVDLRQIPRIAAIIRRFRPHVLHCHQYTPFFYGGLAALGSPGVPVLIAEHGRHFPDRVSRKRRLFNRLLDARAGKVTAVCDFTRRSLVANEGLCARRIEIIPNGIDLEPFDRLPDRAAARARLGLPDRADVIVHVGSFRPIKDHPTALRAMAMVLARRPAAVLVCAGEGPQLSACQTLARQLRIERAVRFLGRRDDVPAILAAGDLALSSSLCEAHSLAMLEAMAAGCPVVATRVGGVPETVPDGRTGLLVGPQDPHAMAQALITLLEDDGRRAAMSRAAAEHVRTHFSNRTMHQRYLDIYRRLSAGAAR